MRLLNTTSITFEKTDNVGDHSYAILPHYWSRDVVSYEDLFFCASSWNSFGGITKDVAGFLPNDTHTFLARLSAVTLIATHNAGIIAAG